MKIINTDLLTFANVTAIMLIILVVNLALMPFFRRILDRTE